MQEPSSLFGRNLGEGWNPPVHFSSLLRQGTCTEVLFAKEGRREGNLGLGSFRDILVKYAFHYDIALKIWMKKVLRTLFLLFICLIHLSVRRRKSFLV